MCVGVLLHTGCAARRDPNGPPLQLHAGAGGTKFSYNTPAIQSVYDWFSLDTAFVTVLSADEGALAEARKATPYHTAALVTSAASLVFSALLLIEAVNKDPEDSFTSSDVDSWQRQATFALGFALVGTVFEQIGLRHLKRSVSAFNVGAAGTSAREDAHNDWLKQSLLNLSVAPSYHATGGFRLMTQTRLFVR